jgi:hypothetical protein
MNKREYGIRMGGNEYEFEKLFSSYISQKQNQETFSYLEIGIANGKTFKCISDIVKENNINDAKLFFLGIDVKEGYMAEAKEWHLRYGDFLNVITIENENDNYEEALKENHANFIICEANKFLKNFLNREIDICFIDGCHGYECAKNNFLNIEQKIKKGGFVIFHDAGFLEQGSDYQHHCNDFINVRKAIKDIGLLDNKYQNWSYVKETQGSRKIGLDGNSCSIFKKL